MTLQEKRAQMLSLVESWQQPSMTQNEFARQNHITLSRFRYWVHKSRTFHHALYFSLGKIQSGLRGSGTSVILPNFWTTG